MRSSFRQAIRYAAALTLVVLAYCLRQALNEFSGGELPVFITFYPTIMVAALLGGFGTGIFTTAASATCVSYFMLRPAGSLVSHSPKDIVSLSLFTAMGIFMSVISERYLRLREKAAQVKADTRYRETLDSMLEGCQIVGPDLRYRYINEAAEKHCRRLRADLLGKTMTECWPGIAETRLLAIIKECLEVGTEHKFDYEFTFPDGQREWFRLGIKKVMDGVAIFSEDITERKTAEEVLRQSEERLRLAHQAAGIGAFEWNIRTGVNTWSPELEKMYGLEPGSFGRTHEAWLEFVFPPDREGLIAAVDRALASGEPVEGEWRVPLPDGSLRWVSGRFQAFKAPSGEPLRLIGVNMDVTAPKTAEEMLRNSEERYHSLFETESDAVLLVDCATGRFVDVNSAAVSMYGHSREEFLQLRHFDLSAEPARPERAVVDLETAVPLRLHKKKDGTVFPVEIAGGYFVSQGRRMHAAAVRDLTQRQKTKQYLMQLNQRLLSLSEHLQMVQERERTAIARDIHDDIGQNVTLLRLDLEWLESRIPDLPELRERMDEMRAGIDQLTATVHRIVADLRPPLLDGLGLTAALEWHLSEFGRRSGIECFLMLNEEAAPPDLQIATAIMRIVQEALTNVARHARATEVGVSLCRKGDYLILEVSDNGCGAESEKLSSPSAYGVLGMQERARICKGTLEINGKKGGGTVVRLTLPLEMGETIPC